MTTDCYTCEATETGGTCFGCGTTQPASPVVATDANTWVSHPRPVNIPIGMVWVPGTTIVTDAPEPTIAEMCDAIIAAGMTPAHDDNLVRAAYHRLIGA